MWPTLGGRGSSRAELEAVLRGDDPVTLRLEALVRDNMIAGDGNGYALTAKGWGWARCLAYFEAS